MIDRITRIKGKNEPSGSENSLGTLKHIHGLRIKNLANHNMNRRNEA